MNTYLLHTYELIYLVEEKIKSISILSKRLDRKPQSYWTTYLQTPMIGSGAPVLKAIAHLLTCTTYMPIEAIVS